MFPTNINQKPTLDCIHWAQKRMMTTELEICPLPEHAHKDKHHYTITNSHTNERHLLVESYNDVPSMLKFITLAKILRHNHIHAPTIFHQEITTHRCWVIMSHFGHETLLDWLLKSNNPIQKQQVFEHCMVEIKNFQKQKIAYPLSNYRASEMHSDMTLTDTHFMGHLLGDISSPTQKAYLAHAKSHILETSKKIPTGIMHFDFHSANLMLLPKRTLGILDFQDLKIGPINYDLVSLLTDHYYQHNPKEIIFYIDLFYDKHLTDLQKQNFDKKTFHDLFKIIAAQRHLKNIGIFSRLFFNDKKHYIQHIPLMMQQLRQQCADYKALQDLPEILWSKKMKDRFKDQVHNYCKETMTKKKVDALLTTMPIGE